MLISLYQTNYVLPAGMHEGTNAHARARTHKYAYVQTERARAHAHTHTHTHAHQRTYVHTHMRAETPRVNVSCAVRARNEVKTQRLSLYSLIHIILCDAWISIHRTVISGLV